MSDSSANNIRLLYVIGAGHSGSTILDAILGFHPDAMSLGELWKLPGSGWVQAPDRRCACSRPVHECPFWEGVKRRWLVSQTLPAAQAIGRYAALQQRVSHWSFWWPRGLWRQPLDGARRRVLSDFNEATWHLLSAMSSEGGKTILIDSSKNPFRARALAGIPDIQLDLVHLVRDGRGYVQSVGKARRKDPGGGIPEAIPSTGATRAAFYWVYRNLASEWVARDARLRIHRVRYDDLVTQPESTIEEIGRAVDLSYGSVARSISGGTEFGFGHMVAGNSVRLRGATALRRSERGAAGATLGSKVVFAIVGGLLNRRYGYSIPGPGGEADAESA